MIAKPSIFSTGASPWPVCNWSEESASKHGVGQDGASRQSDFTRTRCQRSYHFSDNLSDLHPRNPDRTQSLLGTTTSASSSNWRQNYASRHGRVVQLSSKLPGITDVASYSHRVVTCSAIPDSSNGAEPDSSDAFREQMERMMSSGDEQFSGSDLAALIRQKYGKSYDVMFIRKEFMGRQFLAMNIMWKFREQKSFPLSEEEYILRLDGIADNLRFWGAVSLVRSAIQATKERPRIGKAVSIFIDMDDSGSRSNEWISS